MKLLWKLLRRHVNAGQITGFSIANAIGLTVILCGVMFWHDVTPLFEGRDALAGNSYVVISKPFDTVSSFLGDNKTFDESEIAELQEQHSVRSVGRFTPSTYEVYARIGLGNSGIQMSTDMFFESVPDGFVDVESKQWTFAEDSKYIPIILPRNYLDLYNFGFAATRGLPKISEEAANLLNLDIEVGGNGQRENYIGFIAGFSSRLNTILVPQAFMDYANERFGKGETSLPSRLILEVTNPSDESLTMLLKDWGYVISEGDDGSGRLAFFLRVVVGMVVTIGLVICALAFFVFTLSIYLLLEKNMEKLENLLLLGYSPLKTAAPYLLLTAALGILQIAAAMTAACMIRHLYATELSTMFDILDKGGATAMVLTAALLFAVQLLLDFTVIISRVRRINRPQRT